MKFVEGGICAAHGFLAAGIYSGIKSATRRSGSANLFGGKNPLTRDLAIIFSEVPAAAAGVFTTNKIKANCVIVSKGHLKDNKAQAIIANSGNANCCTGPQGLQDARQMAKITAKALDIDTDDVLVASTGIIGKALPMGKIINSIPQLVKRLGTKNNKEVQEAIMTTDKIRKGFSVRFKIGKNTVTIGGIAKGSGMISPNMATMLSFITTDAPIAPRALKVALKECVDKSFNSISVDAAMSTNDMVLILANGAAANKKITLKTKASFEKFSSALLEVTTSLAKMIVKDGEGATKFIEVFVKGAKNPKDAKLAARAVCNSNLVKTAIHGQDANWGRIAASVGASKAEVSAEKLSIYFDKTKIYSNGKPLGINGDVLKKILSNTEIKITIDLGLGKSSATMWTCDLSEEYIKINAKYRT